METTLRSCRKSGEDSVCEFESEDIEWPWEDVKIRGKEAGVCHREFSQFYLYRPDVRGQPAFLMRNPSLTWLSQHPGLPWKFILHHV